jgi:hypothetical protein
MQGVDLVRMQCSRMLMFKDCKGQSGSAAVNQISFALEESEMSP